MLKRSAGDRFRLVTQPDHAALSGYLAAHWGNESFRPLGLWDSLSEPETVRREIVFGIAQHDNGWWEWETDPEIDPQDGLPLDFLQGDAGEGFERWKRGAARFEHDHPFASVLINRHAYWLQAARVVEIQESQFRHPLFGFRPKQTEAGSSEADAVREFLVERLSHERVLLDRLAAKRGVWDRATYDDTLLPAVRMLQVLDTVSLALCGGSTRPLTLLEVPRRSWTDRVTVELTSVSDRRVGISPYPFDEDPLPVAFPARIVEPHTRLAGAPLQLIEMELSAA